MIDHDAQMDSSLAAQYDDVMNSAYDQGFTANEASAPQQQQTAPVQLQQQQSQAQSAIARILQDRNISGAGRLSGAATQTNAKAEPQPEAKPKAEPPAQQSAVATNHQPQQQQVAVHLAAAIGFEGSQVLLGARHQRHVLEARRVQIGRASCRERC